MAPQRGLYFHVCQSPSIPAQGGHKYTFMPPREILKGAVCPSPVWTRTAIFLIDDGSKVWRMPQRVSPSHLFGSFTFEHNSCSAVFMWALDSSALLFCFSASQKKSDLAGGTSQKSHIFLFNSFKIAGSLLEAGGRVGVVSQFSIFRQFCAVTADSRFPSLFYASRASSTHKDMCVCKRVCGSVFHCLSSPQITQHNLH